MTTRRDDNSMTSTEERPSRRFENVKKESDRYILIWLDENANANEENLQTQDKLRQIIPQLIIFENISAWINSSISLAKRKVILLVSESCGRQIVPAIHSFSRVTAIYVYSSAKLSATWTGNYPKCQGVFRQSDQLIRAILNGKQLLERVENDSVVFDVCDSRQSEITSEEKHSRNATFMFFQVLIDVLLKMTSDQTSISKQDLIDHFKRIYAGDQTQLQVIKEFENEYRPDKAVWWYTRPTFLYSTLNKALRDSDDEVLVALRFFINDLHTQLTSERSRTASLSVSNDSILRVYRGQNIAIKEVNYMLRNVGQFLSIHNFLSTSLDRNVAIFFVESNAPITAWNTRILLEFNIDTRIANTKPYANITRLSFFGEEKEVLLMSGCIFRIDQLNFDKSEQCWIAILSLGSEDNDELKDLMKQTKSDIGVDITSLGYLLGRRGDYEHAETYFLQLLSETSLGELDEVRCYHGLGSMAAYRHQYGKALEYHLKELELTQKRPNAINIARTHMMLGQTYWKIGDLDTALAYLEKARPILDISRHPQLSNVYSTMGNIYKDKNDMEPAIQHYEKALQLDRQHLPPYHENFGIIYANMGHTYNQGGKHHEALEYFHKATEVLVISLPPTHLSIQEIQTYIWAPQAKIEQDRKP